MLFGLAGWFVGYDGHFLFDNIGDSYTENHVPYVGMRALSAFMSSMTVPVVYGVMKECGYSTIVAAFSACLVLFGASYACTTLNMSNRFSDNAHVAQGRLILLDAILIFFISMTMYCYVRFRKLRYQYVCLCFHASQ